jgi:hypothetical protein
MTAPRRLLEDPAMLGDGLGKALLESGLSDPTDASGPSAALKAQMWSSIEAALPLVGAAAAAGSAASGAGASGTAAGGAAAGSAAAGGAAAGSTAAAVGGAAAGTTAAAAPIAGLTFVTKIGLASIFIGGSLATAGVVRQRVNETEAPPAIVAPADPAPFASGDGSQRLPAVFDTIGNGSGGAGSGGAGSQSASDAAPAQAERTGAERRTDDGSERAAASKKDDKARASGDKHGDTSSSASKLVEEAAGVQQARQSLAQGNPSRALSILSQLDKDIPRGGLGQERAIISIEALAASGQRAEASQRAKAFLAANPSSPYADRVRRHAE